MINHFPPLLYFQALHHFVWHINMHCFIKSDYLQDNFVYWSAEHLCPLLTVRGCYCTLKISTGYNPELSWKNVRGSATSALSKALPTLSLTLTACCIHRGTDFKTSKRIVGFKPAQNLSSFLSSLMFGTVVEILLASSACYYSLECQTNAVCFSFILCHSVEKCVLAWEISQLYFTSQELVSTVTLCVTSLLHYPSVKLLRIHSSNSHLKETIDFNVRKVSNYDDFRHSRLYSHRITETF